MDSLVTRYASIATLGLALLSAANCGPSPGATFAPATGVLSVVGTANGEVIVVRVASNGSIVVNNGQMPIQGGVPTVANTHRIDLRGAGGDDFLELDESGGPLPAGRLFGGAGKDVLIGGSGNDEIDGGSGDDVALMGDGDDTFVWKSNGGVDTVEGEGGIDTLRFEGDDAAANVAIAAASGRVAFSQDVGGVTTDLNGVETIRYLACGGADSIVVGDMTGTALTRVDVDLSASTGGGDGQVDAITLTGTSGGDGIGITGEAGGIYAYGLPASLHIVGQEPGSDRLTINALGGDDVVDASAPGADAIQLVINGGVGIDELIGSDGDDQLNGGLGNDLVQMGAGDDTFVWNPGDGLDTLDGEDGVDTLIFNGANVNETFDISAVGGRVRFTRNVAAITLDIGTIEAIDLLARGGSDLILVEDLSGTGLLELNLDLAANGGGGDLQPDSVLVNGTVDNDTVQIFGDANEVSVLGLPASVYIASPESVRDSLYVATLAGDDVIFATNLTTPSIMLTEDGGDDDDVLIGGDGADVLLGGNGDDVLEGGPGLDILDGGTGDNIVIQ